MNAKIFLEAVDAIETEKGIARELVLQALKEALQKAMKKQLGADEDAIVRVDIDENKLGIKIYRGYEVVEDVEDDFLQISLEDAKERVENVKVGDIIEEEISIDDMSKATAQLTASVFKQKIAEAEKASLYELFKDQVGEMVTGQIEKIDERSAIVNIGRTSVYLPRKNMIPNERFSVGDSIKLYVSEVINTTKGAQINVTRTDAGFLRRLFEEEVHEVYDGTVIIKAIAREAGERSKVAVYSLDPNVPATGACIGPNGSRIQKIVSQLGNAKEREKIDIINYNENPGLFIMEALKPASVIGVSLDEESKKAVAVVKNDELSLAIGKLGVNARLAVKLTGWNIDIKELDNALSSGVQYMTADELKRDFEAKKMEKAYEARKATEEQSDVEEKVAQVEEELATDSTENVEIVKSEEKPMVEDVANETKQEENKEETKVVQQVKTTKSLADLEKQLEDEKKRLEKSSSYRNERRNKKYDDDKKKTEEKDEEDTLLIDKSKIQKMDIYTEEELRNLEQEDSFEEYDDEDVDYDEYDIYYDEK